MSGKLLYNNGKLLYINNKLIYKLNTIDPDEPSYEQIRFFLCTNKI